MSQWYHAHKGQTIGPFSEQEIEEMIAQNRIGIMDLIFKVGADEWRPLAQWAEFSKYQSDCSESAHQWMIYLDRTEEKKQLGPFSTEQVHRLIADGEIQLNDYIWKEGMTEWYPIKTLQEFKTKSETTMSFNEPEVGEDLSVYKDSAIDLLKSIKVKDAKQVNEITETISSFSKQNTETSTQKSPKTQTQTKTLTKSHSKNFVNPNVQTNSIESFFVLQRKSLEKEKLEREKQKQELRLLREQLNEKIKFLFGEESDLNSNNTHFIQDKTPLIEQANKLTEELPLRKRLAEEGFVDKSKPKDVSAVKEEGSQKVVSILKDEDFFAQRPIGFWERWNVELEALFPKGSLLRLFVFFFFFFAASVIIFLSSYNDRIQNKEQKQSAIKVMKDIDDKQQKIQSEKRARLELEAKKIEKQRLANIKRPPSFIKVSIKKEGSFHHVLVVQTDASKHYRVSLEIAAKVGDILGGGGYYYSFESFAKETLEVNLRALKLPEGYINFKVTIDNLLKNKRYFNSSRDKIAFNKDLESHKKQIAVWHQKEKRSLYASVENLKNWGLQLSSLVPLYKLSQQRWERAYKSWKSRLFSNQSDYLKGIHKKIKGKYVYPKLWLKLKGHIDQLNNLPINQPYFDYLEFSTQMQTIEKEVAELSLW